MFTQLRHARFAAEKLVFQRKGVLSRERDSEVFPTSHCAIADVWLIAFRACNISEGLATILHDCLKSILSRRDMTLITPYKAAGRNMGWKTIVTLAAVHYRLASKS
ncbi:MAG: hypothetical protein J6W84_01780 [Bacteroidales bacterium]|nr:hypothetical protein [Bacteroidales bacterium]